MFIGGPWINVKRLQSVTKEVVVPLKIFISIIRFNIRAFLGRGCAHNIIH